MWRTCLLRMLAAFCIATLDVHCARPDDAAISQASESQHNEVDRSYRGRTIAAWISTWDEGDFDTRQATINSLASAGAPAVDELVELIQKRHRHSGLALQTLAKMGESARAAMPTLLELAADRDAKDPAGWTWNVPMRALLLSQVKAMGWAADQWIPVLRRLAEDPSESAVIRARAISGLGGMGVDATPILTSLALDHDDEVRKSANAALANTSDRGKRTFYVDLIQSNPLDANVPDYLVRTKERYNNGQLHPQTQFVKATLRERLASRPDADIAWALARIIRNGLANTDLTFAVPSDYIPAMWSREDPSECFATLAQALQICLEHAPKHSDLFQRSGSSLARLRLLQGDWEGMNSALERLGREPIAAERRAWLPAPPPDWSDLSKDWQDADEHFRTGDCAIEFQFEKKGQGLAGAHVLISRVPQPHGFSTGISVDTLLHATHPLEAPPYDPFGYYAKDRAMTRYGVSDSSGKIHFDRLPDELIRIEILVPTGNFLDRWPTWDLLMEVAPGELRSTKWGSISRTEGPAVVQLQKGATVQYPKLVVRPSRLETVPAE